MNSNRFDELFTNPKKTQALRLACLADFKTYIQTIFYSINRKPFQFKQFHIIIIKKLQDIADRKNTKRHLMLNLPVGCVTGDTIIQINRNKNSDKMPIEKCYKHFNHIGKKRYFWMKDRKTYTRSASNNSICLQEIEDIVYSGKKQIYLLQLEDGKKIKATADHKILTKEGYKELINLKTTDLVAVDNQKKLGRKEHKKPINDKYFLVGRKHPYASYVGNCTWEIEIHRAIYEAHINNLTLEQYKKACYTGEQLKFIDPKIYHIHHKDGNHFNNDISNLECLTVREHFMKHNLIDNFGQGSIDYSPVKSITKLGIEDTYDIVMKKTKEEPNFVANGIVIHNSGKSLLVELFITWCFARNINCKFCYVSHSDSLINKLSRETKEIIQSFEWQTLFQHKIKKDEKSRTQYSFEGAGTRTGLSASSIGGAITGVDAGNPNIDDNEFDGGLIIDDPMDVSDAKSEIMLQESIRMYTDKLKTRLRTSHTPVIIVAQRISLDDLPSYIISKEQDDYDIVTIEALQNNESYWPERISTEELLKIQKENPGLFAAQYQQNPIVDGGNLFKEYMLARDAMPQLFDFTFITADTAYKEKQENDYTVFFYCGVKDNQLFVINILRDKIPSSNIEAWAMPLMRYASSVYGFRGCYIEPKGHGIYLNQKLPQTGIIMPSPEQAEEFFKDRRLDKVARANAILPYLAYNKVTFNINIPEQILNEVFAEIMNFPKAKHDDSVDCFIDACKIAHTSQVSILDVL